ncbi:MAG: flavoprotein [Phycisphaerae bacterium]
MAGREIVLCVGGGIAAYKAAALTSILTQRGAGVTVAMTRNARRFVGPITFEALSGRPVFLSQWRAGRSGDVQHLALSSRADLIVLAPATADLIGKLAGGLADDHVSALLLGAACPILLAPAMNARMWAHPAVRRNVAFLRAHGFAQVGPDAGWQACRDIGPGRMSEPEAIVAAMVELLTRPASRDGRPAMSAPAR